MFVHFVEGNNTVQISVLLISKFMTNNITFYSSTAKKSYLKIL